MSSLQAIADRVEIEALPAEFTDAIMMRDWDRFASLFTDDGAWRMPHIDKAFEGRDAIRAAIERMQGLWHYFVQTVHPGAIRVEDDTAIALYHDRYRRTQEGWKFTERVYEVRYMDTTPLAGSAPGR